MSDPLARQIADELDRAIVGPTGTLIGPDLADMARDRLIDAAARLAAQLRDPDDGIVAETVIDIMGALWPHAAPEDCGRAEWWSTPLGQACGASIGRNDAGHVTYAVAAAMLGVQRGTVSTMAQRGTLLRHPDGGVVRGSVLRRLGRDASGSVKGQLGP